MSEFSDKLRFFLKQSGHTTSSFSKLCNIERTLFHKYGMGDRLPSSYDTVEMIANKLLLSVNERTELLQLWWMEHIGKDLYLQRIKVKHLLENLNNTSSTPAISPLYSTDNIFDQSKEVQIIRSELELLVFLRYILALESPKEHFNIKMCLQPNYSNINNLLLEYCEISTMEVTQLICFHQRQSTIAHNIDYLDHILQLAFRIPDYKIKVYYDDADFHINNMSLLPNLVLTEEFVIQFSYDLNEGIIYHNHEIHDFYNRMFEHLSDKCRCISTNTQTVEDYTKIIIDHNYKYFLNQNPCIGMSFTKEFLEDVLIKEIPNRDFFIKKIIEDASRRTPDYMIHGCYAFFTMQGVRKFLETGKDNEYPPELYRQLSNDESNEIIKDYCSLGETYFVHNLLLDNTKFNYRSNVIIHVEIGGNIIFQKPLDSFQRKFVIVDESSLNELFVDFFASLEDMKFAKSRTESLNYLRSILK